MEIDPCEELEMLLGVAIELKRISFDIPNCSLILKMVWNVMRIFMNQGLNLLYCC